LKDPVRVQVAAKNAAADTVEQSVYFVEKRHKPTLLKHVIASHAMSRVIVFTRTKHGADKVARSLAKAGIRAEAIHGNKSQNARQRSLTNFKSHKPPVLVATDVAARGLDIDEVSHVVNFDLPDVAETYVHRIGRTGRAGATGIAVSFCSRDERDSLRDIEKLLGKKTPIRDDHPEYPKSQPGAEGEEPQHAERGGRGKRHERKPHGQGTSDGRHRSRRRKHGNPKSEVVASGSVSREAVTAKVPAPHVAAKPHGAKAVAGKPKAGKKPPKKPSSYTTMW
jgi:ATP-dependent RNA helicase RhlE